MAHHDQQGVGAEPPAINAARETLARYARHGASLSPASVAFDLVGLDAEGSANGAGAQVDRDCIAVVAGQALACMNGAPLPSDPGQGTWNAVAQVGSAAAYDIAGVSELPYDTFCAECGLLLEGSHIATCNGFHHIAGTRQGRACSCSGILRLQHVRPGDGAAGELQDGRGDRYVERHAGAQLSCGACEGPVHSGEVYYAQVDSTWIECCRCTVVY